MTGWHSNEDIWFQNTGTFTSYSAIEMKTAHLPTVAWSALPDIFSQCRFWAVSHLGPSTFAADSLVQKISLFLFFHAFAVPLWSGLIFWNGICNSSQPSLLTNLCSSSCHWLSDHPHLLWYPSSAESDRVLCPYFLPNYSFLGDACGFDDHRSLKDDGLLKWNLTLIYMTNPSKDAIAYRVSQTTWT